MLGTVLIYNDFLIDLAASYYLTIVVASSVNPDLIYSTCFETIRFSHPFSMLVIFTTAKNTFSHSLVSIQARYLKDIEPAMERISSFSALLDSQSLKRGGLTANERLIYVPSMAGFWGFLLGGYQGGKLAGYQYMAERQHTPPKTVSGWYFYHKTKNYHVMLKATRSGVKTATKLAAICTGYEAIQFSSDVVLFDGATHPFSSVLSGFITSGIFSRLGTF